MGDNDKKPSNPYSGMQFFNSGVPHSRPDSASSSNSGHKPARASPTMSSSSINSEKNSGTPPPASNESSTSHNNETNRDCESPSNESSCSMNGENEMSVNNARLTPQFVKAYNLRHNSRPVSTSPNEGEGNPDDPTARAESSSSIGEEKISAVSSAHTESSTSSREEKNRDDESPRDESSSSMNGENRPHSEPHRNDSGSSMAGEKTSGTSPASIESSSSRREENNSRDLFARNDFCASNSRDSLPAHQAQRAFPSALAQLARQNGRDPKFNAPPFVAEIFIDGQRSLKEQVEYRERGMAWDWSWMTNRLASQKFYENYEHPMPMQMTVAAALMEGLDTWISVERGMGRTTSWMAFVADRVMSTHRARGVVSHIVVAETADQASKLATQFNLIVPYDDRDKRQIYTVWYWSTDKKQSVYNELREFGADVLFTTLLMLPSLLRDPPFNPKQVETLVIDEFPEKRESYEWWMENVYNYFSKDMQSIIVGIQNSHYHNATEILRKNHVVICATVLAPRVLPRQDFVVAPTSREEEAELIHAMETLNRENAGWPMAIFVDLDEDANAVHDFLVAKGFGKTLGQLPRKLDRENWRTMMSRYRAGKMQILICSYDAEKLTDVPGQADIFYGLPPFGLDWLKRRLYRTARVRTGRAITILRENDRQKIPDLKQMLGVDGSQLIGRIERTISNRARQYEIREEIQEDLRRQREQLARLDARLEKANNAIADAIEETRQINILALK